MRRISEQRVWRILDANFNRAKEGLRVCEDVGRFFLDDRTISAQYKKLRHVLADAGSSRFKHFLIMTRESRHDVGRTCAVKTEMRRTSVRDVFWANSQRVKESLRVLEEFLKLVDSSRAMMCKDLRYRVYNLEQKVLRQFHNG